MPAAGIKIVKDSGVIDVKEQFGKGMPGRRGVTDAYEAITAAALLDPYVAAQQERVRAYIRARGNAGGGEPDAPGPTHQKPKLGEHKT